MSKKNVEWEWKKLGDVCEVIAGQSPKGSSYNNNEEGMEFHQGKKSFGKTIIESSGVWTSEITKIASPEDILISVRAPVGPVNFTDRQLCIGRGLAAIRAKHIDKKYLYLFLVYNESNMTSKTGAVFDSISRNDIINFEIPIPPLDEQERIVKVLDDAFEKIDTIKTTVETNLQNAKDLFQTTLANELSITDEKIKQGWVEESLENCCTHIVDCPHSTPKKAQRKTQYPCIRTSELRNGRIYWESMQYLDESEYLKRISRLKPEYNDIVYGREGTFGDAVLLPNTHFFSLGQRTMLLRPDKSKISPKFMLNMIISPIVYNQAKAKNKGCGVGHVNVGDIKQFYLPLPPLPVQKQIVAKLDTLSEKVKQLESNYKQVLADCDELKKALLKQAFEGML
ncbi:MULTISPECIES: restriction endonuclease subunit S [unclassified Fibrobacter]|uniref:restriction endonuclease subunit S n=1 Tax=unclassified Fibrobacter TaxID=2634177 RepID=UPI000917A5D8|nr:MULTISPECIES: restriction endonuclease subunit S [unclassified Fibrobacter]OWV03983.1 hypothetical protein B7993_12160 [Fibrobacter sp. UWH3]SHL39343.1 type I restriction enzyme, S subunit [Fibrobacter sp. UWH6]